MWTMVVWGIVGALLVEFIAACVVLAAVIIRDGDGELE